MDLWHILSRIGSNGHLSLAPPQPPPSRTRAHLFHLPPPPGRRFVRREVKEASPSLDANLAVTWMRLVATLITPIVGEWGSTGNA